MSITPQYANAFEMSTFTTTNGVEFVMMRFFFLEPKDTNYKSPFKPPVPEGAGLVIPVATIIMERKVARDFVKRSNVFMQIQGEGRVD